MGRSVVAHVFGTCVCVYLAERHSASFRHMFYNLPSFSAVCIHFFLPVLELSSKSGNVVNDQRDGFHFLKKKKKEKMR